jgi:uncharacterized phage protein (TIGR02218 family)
MPTVPPSLALSLASEETQIARLYWIQRRDGVSYLLTDWQLPVRMFISEPPVGLSPNGLATFMPQQSPESSAIASDVGLGSSNASISSYVKLGGISIGDIRLGLFQDSQVNVYFCDPSKTDSAVLLVSGYIAGGKNLGDEKFEMEFRSIEQKYSKNIGQTVTERCPLKLGEKQCGITARSIVAVVSVVESPHSFILDIAPDPVLEVSNFWQFGSLYNELFNIIDSSSYVITVNGNIIKSSYLGGGRTRIITLNAIEPLLEIGQSVTLLEGCGCTVEDCNNRGNIINFHGFPDLPGVDKLITSAV